MKCFDAIIVGAGPAGSTCGGQLRKAGLDVLVLDKKVFPRVKPCAGWITPQVVEALQIDLEEYRQGRVWQPIQRFRTGMIGGTLIETSYSQPVSFGILRREFDDYLLTRSGVRCEFQAVKKIERSKKGWTINGQYSSNMLIGAAGHFCPVARYLRNGQVDAASSNVESVVVAQEVEFELPDEMVNRVPIAGDTPELYFCNDLLGYGWCFRKGNFLNIGLGRLDQKNLSGHVKAFCDFLRDQRKLNVAIPPHFLGHAYQIYNRPPKLVDEAALLIGDAAGLAYPNSGEGIRPAVESGLLAARTVQQAAGDYSAAQLSNYEHQLTQRLGKPKSGQLPGWLPATWLCRLAARLMVSRWFAKHVVIDNWFLHRHQPTLGNG